MKGWTGSSSGAASDKSAIHGQTQCIPSLPAVGSPALVSVHRQPGGRDTWTRHQVNAATLAPEPAAADKATQTPEAPDAVGEALATLERLRREPPAPTGWIMRQRRTSPLETRFITR